MQLFSFEQQKSQPLEAHAAAFSTVKVRQQQRPACGKAAYALARRSQRWVQAAARTPWCHQDSVAWRKLWGACRRIPYQPSSGASGVPAPAAQSPIPARSCQQVVSTACHGCRLCCQCPCRHAWHQPRELHLPCLPHTLITAPCCCTTVCRPRRPQPGDRLCPEDAARRQHHLQAARHRAGRRCTRRRCQAQR
jgi:hypothetical protein